MVLQRAFHPFRKSYQQFGALPFRWSDDGSLTVMLVTTRGRKRWMVPKGWPIPELEPHESAAREAFEEAGLVGSVDPRAIGSFRYRKRLGLGRQVPCTVEVFPLHVDHQAPHWPEKGERETRWMSIDNAAGFVSEPELKKILLAFHPNRDHSDEAGIRSAG
ncbi:NUDIX hydrolase [Microvirga sp. HBU67558]|uniref:NUDIX hydrolase n=1 Tax=Microvirga TaxID=186650 RepID=UPI001B36157E|nr:MULTISPECIES: NUDIX hydrolase [unclassified Microvirga]MBQ0822733.1 NUDIX hydrolase [Microvirga sp. HBU67558]